MIMIKKILLLGILGALQMSANACCCDKCCKGKDLNSVEDVLHELGKRTETMKSFQADINYTFLQPLFDASTTRKGKIFYKRDPNESKLRVSFTSISEDEMPAREYREEYIFDGHWLERINFQTKHVEKRRIAGQGRKVDMLELVSRNFPLVGFSKVGRLKSQYDIELKEIEDVGVMGGEPNDFRWLSLTPRDDYEHKHDFIHIDFWVDVNSMLPGRIMTTNSEEDLTDIVLKGIKINKFLENAVFEVEKGDDFSENIVDPKKDSKQ